MKKELTFKEATELFDLGVPKEMATGKRYFENVVGYYKTFTVTDLLEVLPKAPLFIADDEDSYMQFQMVYYPILKKWCVGYYCLNDKYRGVEFIEKSEELIDALYKLTCCYYKYHLKCEKDEL